MTTLTNTAFRQNKQDRTNDVTYWEQLNQPLLIKESGIIDYIDFNPSFNSNQPQPYAGLAVTCSAGIQIYNPAAFAESSTLCGLKENVYGGTFNKDGRFLVCGDEEGCVRLFEMSSGGDHRPQKKHTAAVHRTFFTADQLHIASFSDDRTVRLWDASNEKCVTTFVNAHADFIRAGCVSPVSPDTLVSGGCDGKVKMYDTRTNSSVFEVNHGSTVRSVMFDPTGGILVSCGGPYVKIWDAFAGGRLMAMMSKHDEDIMCLRLACNGRRLLSGGLDGKVNIYDTTTYRTVKSFVYPTGVFSIAVAPDEGTLAVGMKSGIVSVERMDSDREIKMPEKIKLAKMIPKSNQILEYYRPPPEPEHNELLRKHEYSEALRAVFTPICTNKTPHITFGLMRELLRRQGMECAIKGQRQPNTFLINLLTFLIRHIDDHRFNRVLIDVSNILLDVYEDDFSSLSGDVVNKFMQLNTKLRSEEKLLNDCLELQGTFELLLSGANVVDQNSDILEYGYEEENT